MTHLFLISYPRIACVLFGWGTVERRPSV
jgi:hypothetical protein